MIRRENTKSQTERLLKLIKKQRKYALHFEWKIKPRKELGIVEILIEEMRLQGDNWFYCPQSLYKNDPPDCVAKDNEDKDIGIEVTELVDSEAIIRNQKGDRCYRDWHSKEVIERIQDIINKKDYKKYNSGLYTKNVLVIYTDEITISHKKYCEVLEGHVFMSPNKIDVVYMLFSYDPAPPFKSYPYVKLNIGK